MDVQDAMRDVVAPKEKRPDPQTLNFIERILYYENLTPMEADNDNRNSVSDSKGSACFDSWALPDFMRR